MWKGKYRSIDNSINREKKERENSPRKCRDLQMKVHTNKSTQKLEIFSQSRPLMWMPS